MSHQNKALTLLACLALLLLLEPAFCGVIGRHLSVIGHTLSDCIEFNPDGSCKTCINGKTPWGGLCVFLIPGCAAYNPDGQCSHC